jgi:carbonic anhydrase/acetyltransferase-like protein (isoleucine patch superfamily)
MRACGSIVLIRGDNDVITIGENSQVQDVIGPSRGSGISATLGSNVSIGHMVMLHGCSIGNGSLVVASKAWS